MIKFSVLGLDRDGIDFDGSEPAAILEVEDSELLSCKSPVEYNLHAALVNNGILVTGNASTEIKVECGRCLKMFKHKIKVKNICHFYEKVKVQELDITDDIREDILIAFPTNCFCKKECKGLCHKCGADLNKTECSCKELETPVPAEENAESPWSELDKLALEPAPKKKKTVKTVKKR